MKKVQVILISILGLMLIGAYTYSQESYKIIVNPSNPVSSMTKTQISDLFLKKIKILNGVTALPVDQLKESIVRQAFTQDIHGKSVSSITAYWQKMIYSGRGVPPVEKTSDQDVIAYVTTNPGAIGYVSESAPGGEVKIVSIIQ